MAISNKIAQLTALALRDRVMTYVERQTIVKAAIEEGTAEEEINAYLDKAFSERLKYYTKEDLTHCPHCGAQIPLLSDVCFYCGEKIVNNKYPSPDLNSISGEEAYIIKNENRKTAEEHSNPTNCPDCGAPFPLVSNICLSCGHILQEHAGSDFNIKNLIIKIKIQITEIERIPKPTVKDVFFYRLYLVLTFLAIVSLIAGITFPLMVIPAVILIWIVYKIEWGSYDAKSPVYKTEDAFYSSLYDLEKYKRNISTLYGDDIEAKNVLAEFKTAVTGLKKVRNKNTSILTTIILALALAAIVPTVTLSRTPNEEYLDNRELHLEIYKISEMQKNIEADPNGGIHSRYQEYFSAKGKACLTFDVLNKDSEPFIISPSGKMDYKLRVSGIRLESKGVTIDAPDTTDLCVCLWSKDLKPVGERIYPIRIEKGNLKNGCCDNVYSFLKKGSGSYYADFVSMDTISSTQEIKDIMDSAYYYTVF